jgi:phosphatidylglycerophosphate synthase
MKKHIWTSIAIVFAILIFVSGIQDVVSGIQDVMGNSGGGKVLTGKLILLSAIACRSANKRKLKEVNNTNLRKIIEALLMLNLILLVVLQNDLAVKIQIDPAPNLIIPIVCLIFYLSAYVKANKANAEIETELKNDEV